MMMTMMIIRKTMMMMMIFLNSKLKALWMASVGRKFQNVQGQNNVTIINHHHHHMFEGSQDDQSWQRTGQM